MYEHAAEYETVYHAKTPYEVMKTKWLSFDDVLKIKQVEEMLEVYYNSGHFEITMKVMEPLFDSAFAMFQELVFFTLFRETVMEWFHMRFHTVFAVISRLLLKLCR